MLHSFAAALSTAAHAQSASQVTARDPAAMVEMLEVAGYSPSLTTDSTGDPMISLTLAGYQSMILFYGCDTSHINCDSVQLRAGFDRETPWTAADALAVAKEYRFASLWLDESGDPWVQWDIVTGDGIPAAVFLDSLGLFSDTLADTASMVFADE